MIAGRPRAKMRLHLRFMIVVRYLPKDLEGSVRRIPTLQQMCSQLMYSSSLVQLAIYKKN
jgi:hypothetical protein